uniref:Uncharacterized protein n=1 Tax=Anguilla anguilla TaxID=7936 RepID=A0A0E9VS88_ANGAN
MSNRINRPIRTETSQKKFRFK